MKTKHNPTHCRMAFGRPTPEREQCGRCDGLRDGAAPRKGWGSRTSDDARHAADIRAHFASHRHVSGGCGPVCTFGEW